MQRTLTTLFLLLLPLLAPLAATADSLALSIMERLYLCGEHSSMELIDAELYLKQRVEAKRKNLLVNYFPNMTRFDKDENSYLSEYLYKVRYNFIIWYKKIIKKKRFEDSTSSEERFD